MIEQNEIIEQNIVKKIHIKGFEGTFMNLIFIFITAEEGRPWQRLASLYMSQTNLGRPCCFQIIMLFPILYS